MAIICMLFPGVIYCYIRHKILGKAIDKTFDSIKYAMMEYICSTVSINTFVIVLRWIIKHVAGNIIQNINENAGFAVKYLFSALIISFIMPFIEKYCRNNIHIDFEINHDVCRSHFFQNIKKRYTILYVIFLGMHHFVRCFNNSFWGDEGITIVASRMVWSRMLLYVASNGHSPFYYAVVWFVHQIFGESGFLFHFVSALPYFIILVLALTIIWKWFGTEVVLIFTTLSTLLDTAIVYNMEIRMYAWCQLFILLIFITAYQIYNGRKNYPYILMTCFSLGAVYSHYFALAVVGLFYFLLLIYACVKNRHNMWKVITSGIGVLIGFIPWLYYNYKNFGRIMSNYSLPNVEWKECLGYIFHSRISMILLLIFGITLILTITYEIGIVSFERDNDKMVVSIKLREKIFFNAESIWIISGVLSVFGTIAAAKMISYVMYPIIVLRYLYPSFIIIWLVFAVNISKCKLHKLYSLALIILILVSCYPNYLYTLGYEIKCDKRLETTLSKTREFIDENSHIYTNIIHFAWTLGEVYYPDTTKDLIGNTDFWGYSELPQLDDKQDNWLFWSGSISDNVIKNLELQNKKAELVAENAFVGIENVWIYRVKSIK